MLLDECAIFFNKIGKNRFTRPLAKTMYYFTYDFLAFFYKLKMKHQIKHIHGIKRLDSASDKVIVCCLVRNGQEYIESFMAYYFQLGVEHIIFIDNGSTDHTMDIAKTDKRVSIYQTNLTFKVYKNIIRRYMVEQFSNGGWTLCVDIDEFYDFPNSNKLSFTSFISYLNKNSYTAVAAYLLDMVSNEKKIFTSNLDHSFNRSDYEYYDLSQIQAEKYDKHITMINNKINNKAIKSYKGGVRKTIFDIKPKLLKHPLIYYNKILKPFYGSHGIRNANIADISCVLYHYKFTEKFIEKIDKAIEEENYYCNSKEYKAYKKTYLELKLHSHTNNHLEKLISIDDLISKGFLQVTNNYKNWIKREEIKNKETT